MKYILLIMTIPAILLAKGSVNCYISMGTDYVECRIKIYTSNPVKKDYNVVFVWERKSPITRYRLTNKNMRKSETSILDRYTISKMKPGRWRVYVV